ncbi:alpha-amylase, partial [Candidatus Roizmanbacteria bacterium RIFCSPLOWO2_02_FULL_43_10]
MPTVCLYLKAHQPRRIKRYRVFDIGVDHEYFNDASETDVNNEKILKKVVEKSYVPTNTLLLKLLKKYPSFKVSFSLTGTLLDQLEEYTPEVIALFQQLVMTGRVEILGETYHHSLSFFYSLPEFERQVELHKKKIKQLFDLEPHVFSNTELAYNNDLAKWADTKGYTGIIAEGWDPILGWRSPNYVYQPSNIKNLRLLLKNYKLSDDIAFRFSERSWQEYPLTVPKYAEWISAHNGDGQVINLFMDYETFGEHQWKETGIFDFLENLPKEILKNQDNNFMTPSEVIAAYSPVGEIDVSQVMTWADTDRDLTAWVGNKMQQDAIAAAYALEKEILATKDAKLINDWRHLLTSDHFYYMCTKWFSDGDVHAYFSP